MNDAYNTELSRLNDLIKEFGGVDSYTTTQATKLFEQIYKTVYTLGINPESRDELFGGFHKIFNIEYINMNDFEQGKYIFVPNHVSEFDGLLFGILIPHMLVVAKTDWIQNPNLNNFVEKLFDVVGLVRKDNSSGISVLKNCIKHLDGLDNGAVTIFVQQTIADIDKTVPEDVSSGACFISKKSGAKIIPVYAEQVSIDHPTRVVFGKPITCSDKKEFGEEWLKCELELRDSLSNPPARAPKLCEKHQKPISERDF